MLPHAGRCARIVPHAMTAVRLPLAGVFYAAFVRQEATGFAVAAAALALAAASDYLDGMLARRLGTAGVFGKWADPLADALFFLAVFASFTRTELMPLPLVLLFVARESLQYGLIRPLSSRRGIDPAARPAGKLKTGLQTAGTAVVLVLAALQARGLVPGSLVRVASAWILSVVIAVSLGSLYWYVLPLVASTPPRRLGASITATLTVHLGANVLAASLAARALGIPSPHPLFFGGIAVYHVLLAGLLILRRTDLDTGGGQLTKVNVPCHLTLIRLSSAPTLAYLVATVRGPPAGAVVLALLALVFLTDLLDGRLARSMGQTTFMGRYLDPVSDYVALFAVVLAAYLAGAIAPWYLGVFAARFTLFPLGMAVLALRRGRVEPESTPLGKASVFAAMTAFTFQLSRAMDIPSLGDSRLVTAVEIAAAGIMAVSLFEKAAYLSSRLRGPRRSAGG